MHDELMYQRVTQVNGMRLCGLYVLFLLASVVMFLCFSLFVWRLIIEGKSHRFSSSATIYR